jgi:hypothetical protein
MKIVTLSKIGYNHPSQTNWNYGIWKIDLIDTSQQYNMSHTVRETFGGETRFTAGIETATGHKVTETKQVYTTTGLPKITGVRSLQDIESKDFMQLVIDFISK